MTQLSPEAQKQLRSLRRNVRRHLRALGLSSYEASRRAGRRGGWISDILRRRGQITLATLTDLADCLGTTVGELCDGHRGCGKIDT